MAAGGLKRRTLAFPREDDVPVQQDEIGLKEDKSQGGAEKLSERETTWRIYIIYFIGFMVGASCRPPPVKCSSACVSM